MIHAKAIGSTCSHTKQFYMQLTNQQHSLSWLNLYANQSSVHVCFYTDVMSLNLVAISGLFVNCNQSHKLETAARLWRANGAAKGDHNVGKSSHYRSLWPGSPLCHQSLHEYVTRGHPYAYGPPI
jgi:hypothetical protein